MRKTAIAAIVISIASTSTAHATAAVLPPTDEIEAAFEEWALAEQDDELFRTVCDVDEALGVTCYGLDETRTPTIAEYDNGAFEVVEPTTPGMVSTDSLSASLEAAPSDCVSAALMPGLIVSGLTLGDPEDFDAAVKECGETEAHLEQTGNNPEVLAAVTAVNEALAAIQTAADSGVMIDIMDPGDQATYLDPLETAVATLSDLVVG